jgi:hypothetical protein
MADPLELTWAAYISVNMFYSHWDDIAYNAHSQGSGSQDNV